MPEDEQAFLPSKLKSKGEKRKREAESGDWLNFSVFANKSRFAIKTFKVFFLFD